ncbi:MAG: hypothetical protein VKK42_11715 [Lyngbya sp.]|nr:hypothetical protein [Lyngbya sp.]
MANLTGNRPNSEWAKFYILNENKTLKELEDSDITPNRPTYVITHGFRDNPGIPNQVDPNNWMRKIAAEISTQEDDANVILVNWDAGQELTDFFSYPEHAQKTEFVGKAVQEMLYRYVDSDIIQPENITLIGHSLGAQVAGFAGQYSPDDEKIGTIIGLDPAGPGFENANFNQRTLATFQSLPERLDKADATRVIAIHTTSNLGYQNPLPVLHFDNENTLDIYLNQGEAWNQPDSNRFNDWFGAKAHSYAHGFLTQLLAGQGFNLPSQPSVNGSKDLDELDNPSLKNQPELTYPLVSLNTLRQGVNSEEEGVNQGIIDINTKNQKSGVLLDEILSFQGTNDRDNLAGTYQADELIGYAEDDLMSGLSGNDSLWGGEGNDTGYGGVGDDIINGEAGRDVLIGGSENDNLFGGLDDDTLRGGAGFDTLLGGQGVDVFILAMNEGTDWIEDFEMGIDLIGLTDNLTFEQLTIESIFEGTQISFSDQILAVLDPVVLTEDVFTLV